MAIALFIILLFYLLYRFLRKKRRDRAVSFPVNRKKTPDPIISTHTDSSPDFRIQKHIHLYHRKTYIKGTLFAKFRGELDQIKDLQGFVRERYFDISLYDAHILDAEFRKNNEGPFPESLYEETFPGSISPSPMPCSISYQGITGQYAILLHDLRLSNVDLNKHRLLHMEEDGLVFGTIEATITGHLLEHFREEYDVRVPLTATANEILQSAGSEVGVTNDSFSPTVHSSLSARTGRTKTENGYLWKEFLNIRTNSPYWKDPIYNGRDRAGCLGSFGWILLAFLAVVFLIAIGPQGILVLLVLGAFGLLADFFSGLFRPVLWLLSGVFFLIGIVSLFTTLRHGHDVLSIPFSHDQSNESSFIVEERTVTSDHKASNIDSLIIHHRVWKDYADSTYEGNIWVRQTDLSRSSEFKNHLLLSRDAFNAYDRMLAAVTTNDSARMPGVYSLFDSIRNSGHLDEIRFAEMVVSFVQDIPYAMILDQDCDPNLYSDPFTRSYLQSSNASCAGYQRFGIHTPLEFMGTLLGDCDTRTLLLYTILNHYDYKVAILSSEVYSHSLLGVVLPVDGTVYIFNDRRYVLWETTTPQIPPGIIGVPFNNLSNWRISLQSKN